MRRTKRDFLNLLGRNILKGLLISTGVVITGGIPALILVWVSYIFGPPAFLTGFILIVTIYIAFLITWMDYYD